MRTMLLCLGLLLLAACDQSRELPPCPEPVRQAQLPGPDGAGARVDFWPYACTPAPRHSLLGPPESSP